MIVSMMSQYRSNLARLKGVAFDVGSQDEFAHIVAGAHDFDKLLNANGIDHEFSEYEGISTPRTFSVDAPEQVQVMGEKKRQILDDESWFLTPKEQGEFFVVVFEDSIPNSQRHLTEYMVYRGSGLTFWWVLSD